MTNTNDSSRRNLLSAAGATGIALLTGAGNAAADNAETDDLQSGPVDGPPYNTVDSVDETLDYVESAINDHLNRPTNSYVADNGEAQIAFDMGDTSDKAFKSVIYVAALAWARAVASATPANGIQFRAYRAVPGEPYEYVASFFLGKEMALNYASAVTHEDHIGEHKYMQWAYNQLKYR